jgi:hypothetical protein
MASTNAAFASGRQQDTDLRRRNVPEIKTNDGDVYNVDAVEAKKAFKVRALIFFPVTSGSDNTCYCSQSPPLLTTWNRSLPR